MNKKIIIMFMLLLHIEQVHGHSFMHNVKKATKKTGSGITTATNDTNNEVIAPAVRATGIAEVADTGSITLDIKLADDAYERGDYGYALGRYIRAVANDYLLGGAVAGLKNKNDIWSRITSCLNQSHADGGGKIDPAEVKEDIKTAVQDLETSKTNDTTFKTKDQVTDYMYKNAADILYNIGIQKMNDGVSVENYQDYFIQAHAMNSSKLIPDTVK